MFETSSSLFKMIFAHSILTTLKSDRFHFYFHHIICAWKDQVFNVARRFINKWGKHFQTVWKTNQAIVVFREKRPIDKSGPFVGPIWRFFWPMVRRLEKNDWPFQTENFHSFPLLFIHCIDVWHAGCCCAPFCNKFCFLFEITNSSSPSQNA